MNSKNKEAYLISQGRNQETIDFVKKCNVSKDNLIWFVTRLEKDKIDIQEKNLKDKIQKISKLIKASPDTRNMNNFIKVYEIANKYFEDENDIESRKLHKFKDGVYILNLSEKELEFEANEMSNCVRDYRNKVKNKDLAILAIKDKNNKTLAHFEVSNFGFLKQHYSKANTPVKYSSWKYINDFFEKNKDEYIFNKLKENGFSAEYNLRDFYNHLPVVEYYIPISRTRSVLNEKERVQEMLRIKDFINTNRDKKIFECSCTAEEAVLKLKEYSKNITEMIDNMSQAIIDSSNNLFILNDNMIQTIFNKKLHSSLHEKLNFITSSSSGNYTPMNFDYIQQAEEIREQFVLGEEIREEIRYEAGQNVENANVGRLRAVEGIRQAFLEVTEDPLINNDLHEDELYDMDISNSKCEAEIDVEAIPTPIIREYFKSDYETDTINECEIGDIEMSEEYTINIDMKSDIVICEENCELSISKEEFIDLRNNN